MSFMPSVLATSDSRWSSSWLGPALSGSDLRGAGNSSGTNKNLSTYGAQLAREGTQQERVLSGFAGLSTPSMTRFSSIRADQCAVLELYCNQASGNRIGDSDNDGSTAHPCWQWHVPACSRPLQQRTYLMHHAMAAASTAAASAAMADGCVSNTAASAASLNTCSTIANTLVQRASCALIPKKSAPKCTLRSAECSASLSVRKSTLQSHLCIV